MTEVVQPEARRPDVGVRDVGRPFWSAESARHIHARIVLEADLVLETPAYLGNGDDDEFVDLPLVRDEATGRPLLTGTNLTGALRSALREREAGGAASNVLTEALFGGAQGDDKGRQSSLIVDDAVVAKDQPYGLERRDHVRLDPETRTARDQALFSLECWQAGTRFPIRLELLLMEHQAEADLRCALAAALQNIIDGRFRIGARTRRGFGRTRAESWKARRYDLTKGEGLYDWLVQGNDSLPDTDKKTDLLTWLLDGADPLPDSRHRFTIEASFAINGSLLIRTPGDGSDHAPDDRHLHMRHVDGSEVPVLTGTSLAGALRGRARRIMRLVNPGEAGAWMDSLFGSEHEKGGPEENLRAGRLVVDDALITGTGLVTDKIQDRVAIDRFTGGARDSALFSQQPVFGEPGVERNGTKVEMYWEIRRPKDRDVGLVLMLLKDLWTGDLPVGGEISIGRGRLRGKGATLTSYDGSGGSKTWTLKDEPIGLRIEGDRQNLEAYAEAMHQPVTAA